MKEDQKVQQRGHLGVPSLRTGSRMEILALDAMIYPVVRRGYDNHRTPKWDPGSGDAET
jgi:hypothetical protein